MPDTQQIPQALSDIVELVAPGSESTQRREAEAIADRGIANCNLRVVHPGTKNFLV